MHSDIAINFKKRLHRSGSCNARGQCPTPGSKNAASIKPFQFFLQKRLHRAGSCNARGQCPTPGSKNAASIKPFQFFLSRGLKLRGEDVFVQQCMRNKSVTIIMIVIVIVIMNH